MAKQDRKRTDKKVKNLPVKTLGRKQSKDVKGGWGAATPQKGSIADGTSNT